MAKLTTEQIEKYKAAIDKLNYEQLKIVMKRAPFNHPIFRKDEPLLKYFQNRLRKLSPFKDE